MSATLLFKSYHPPRGQSQFQFVDHDRCQITQRCDVIRGRFASFTVDNAQRAKVKTIMGCQRYSQIEAQPERPNDQRISKGTWITCGVRDQPWFVLQNCRRTEPWIAAGLLGVQTVVRLKPDPIRVDNADDRDWGIYQPCSQNGDSVKSAIRRRVQNIVAADSIHAPCLVRRPHSDSNL